MKKRWTHLAARLVTALAVVLLLVSTGATTSLRTVKSDIDENAQLGFLKWWHENDLQRGPKWITRNLIVGEPIEVCSEKFPLATAEAVARWNNALKITAFALLSDHTACDTNHRRWVPRDGVVSLTVSLGDGPTTLEDGEAVYQGLVVGRGGDIDRRIKCNDARSLGCVWFDHAKALPGRDNEWHTYYGRAEIVMNPRVYSVDNRWWENLIRDIAHELGHILALRDYFCHISGAPTDVSKNPDRIKPPTASMDTRTLMNSFTERPVCNSPHGRPTKLDLDDYIKIYTPAVVVVDGRGVDGRRVNEPEVDGQTVTLHWNQANVFVESDFEIQRKNGAIWEMEEIADANTESITLTNQPIGEQLYRIRARTLALCPAGEDCRQMRKHVYGGSAEITVSVPPPAPTGPTVTARTPVSLTVSWTVGVGASFHEVKATTRANCNEKSETYETPSSNSATSHPLTDLTPNTPYRLCVRSVRTIGSDSFRSAWAETPETMTTAKLAVPSTRSISDSDITTNTITLRWSKVPDADGYEVKRTTDSGETEIESLPETARWHEFDDLLPSKPYTFYVRATFDAHSSVTSAWASRSATTSAASAPQPVDDPPSISLSVVVKPKRCYPDATVSVDWKVSDATGTPTVTVNDDPVTTTPTSITCESDIRSQPISVSARDSTGSSSSYSTSVTVLEPPVMPDVCLSNMGVGTAAYQTKTSCGAVTASDLLSAIRGDNPDSNVCTIWHRRDGDWLNYGVTLDGQVVPGSVDYTINPGDLLTLGRCISTSDGAGGASGNEPPSCPDALKPASGPVVIDVASTDCATVRGGGAAQISRGDYTLNLTLPSERDWWALAPTIYHDNPGGAFIFLDLTTGGWLALNPADAAELARHAPADADGLPALLDALAASASPPATE